MHFGRAKALGCFCLNINIKLFLLKFIAHINGVLQLGECMKKSYFEDEPLWYKDAVIYELHIKAFCDSNDDGIGDFRGLKSKLDYLERLGITAIWLLPFYPSPLRDDGYDIADYLSIHSNYGQLRDFKEFLKGF